MILSITGGILQKFYLLCYLLFSDVFSDDFIHHCLKFTKYNFLCYLLFSDFLVMILSITGEILQLMLFLIIMFLFRRCMMSGTKISFV